MNGLAQNIIAEGERRRNARIAFAVQRRRDAFTCYLFRQIDAMDHFIEFDQVTNGAYFGFEM
jgi:hypothetical protein